MYGHLSILPTWWISKLHFTCDNKEMSCTPESIFGCIMVSTLTLWKVLLFCPSYINFTMVITSSLNYSSKPTHRVSKYHNKPIIRSLTMTNLVINKRGVLLALLSLHFSVALSWSSIISFEILVPIKEKSQKLGVVLHAFPLIPIELPNSAWYRAIQNVNVDYFFPIAP